MTSVLRVGRTGMMLLVQLVSGLIVPYVFLVPLTAPPGRFWTVGMAGSIRLNVLLLILGGAVSGATAATAWPICACAANALPRACCCLAVAHFTLRAMENAHWLTMLTVSQAYAEAADTAPFQLLAVVVRADFKWAHYSHLLVLAAWFATLYLLFWRHAMTPAPSLPSACCTASASPCRPSSAIGCRSRRCSACRLGLSSALLGTWLRIKGSAATPPLGKGGGNWRRSVRGFSPH